MRDRGGGRLPLKRGLHVDLKRAAPQRIERADHRPAGRVRRHRQRLHAAGKRGSVAAPDRERYCRAGDRQVVSIPHLHHRRHGRLLLDDIDRVFAFDHDDPQRGL